MANNSQWIVKCAVCGEQFDMNTITGVRYSSRRYAHYKCFPEGEKVEPKNKTAAKREQEKDINVKVNKKSDEYEDLTNTIRDLFGGNECNWTIIGAEIKRYIQSGFTYSGIKKTLLYFYKVKGNDIGHAAGHIGIVNPITYNEAREYYYALWQNQERAYNSFKGISDTSIEVETTIEIPNQKILNWEFDFIDEE